MSYILLGAIIYLFGSIGLLIIEFKEHIAWGLLGLFTQIGHGIFAILHFGKCKWYLTCIVIGFILFFFGLVSVSKEYVQENQYMGQEDVRDDVKLPAFTKEYHPNSKLPVEQRVAAPVCDDWPDTGYWLSTNSDKRHNKYCENYRRTRGFPCKKNEGTPCGKCGG